MDLVIRPYGAADASATLNVFRSAIRVTAANDYSADQIDAWASRDINPETWNAARAARTTMVALVDGNVAGFTDIDAAGHIHMLFVDPRHGRRGVATALLDWTRREAERCGARSLTTSASITARPFFESHSFVVTEMQHPVVRGVALRNYAMKRPL